jgi:glycosyltransferase involved in cell wall biosynthesis
VHEQLGLGDSCVFEGRVESIIDAYHAGHVLVSTSISEGFPYAVIEAMASGRAMIATDVGGVSEAIADTGILCPPRDDEAIAEACVQLLLDQPRRDRLAEAGRQRVLSLFTLDICLEQYRQLYDTLREMPREPLARGRHPRAAVAPVAPAAWPRPVAEAFAQSASLRPSRRRLRPALGAAR